MAKIGISVKIDVKKLDKARFFAAQSGATYVDLTMFLDSDNEGQYGDHGFVTQSTSKEEREQGVQMPIVGNGKICFLISSPVALTAFHSPGRKRESPIFIRRPLPRNPD